MVAQLAMATSVDLQPHHIARLLLPPSSAQQQDHVLQQLNQLLPSLAITSPSPNAAFTSLPSADALQTHLNQLLDSHSQNVSKQAQLESQLRIQLLSSLNRVKTLRQRLQVLPDDIAQSEDQLLELCEQLLVRQSNPPAESSRDGPRSLMQHLEKLHDGIDRLQRAKAYFSLLAKAEELRLDIVKRNDDTDAQVRTSALQLLQELANLVKLSQRLATGTPNELPEPKAIAFLGAQRDATFAALRRSRIARLQVALANSGWPSNPLKQDQQQPASSQVSNSIADASFARTDEVKQAWSELCHLQDCAEHLGLLKRASAKPFRRSQSLQNNKSSSSLPPAAGSDNYQPILAIQALIEPLLLRFRYHFDGSGATNRLDKPEWYLGHIAGLIQSQGLLFIPSVHAVPGSGGAVARLCRYYSNSEPNNAGRKPYRYIDTYAEMLHGLLIPLRRKLASSMPALLQHPSLLAHTVFQALTFDTDLRDQFSPSLSILQGVGAARLANDILDNQEWFTRWLEGERDFALHRFQEAVESSNAWTIGSSDSMADDDGGDDHMFYPSLSADQDGGGLPQPSALKTTRSARTVIDILESVSERYRPLPSLSQRLSFFGLVQLPILRAYSQRLTKSLDAFESLSSAFARAMPGEISSSLGAATGVTSVSADSDMVKGLRGLGRLVKAMLSAVYICEQLERWEETAFFVEMSEELQTTEEGRKLALELKRDEEADEDRELDSASLGMLLRRGLKRGRGRGGGDGDKSSTNPVTAGSEEQDCTANPNGQPLLTDFGKFGLWEEPHRKFCEIVDRATRAIERLVTSEVLELLRPYAHRQWEEEKKQRQPSSSLDSEKGDTETTEIQEPDDQVVDIPTPLLIPSLSILSTHLSHLVSILDPPRLIPIYRHIVTDISHALIDRVIIAGGSRRFDYLGAQRFANDVEQGWLGVIRDIVVVATKPSCFGRKPETAWKSVRDAARLLSLPPVGKESQTHPPTPPWTLAKCLGVVFDNDNANSYQSMLIDLGNIQDQEIPVREILRRRIECWK